MTVAATKLPPLIIAAAGKSSRYGSAKGLAKFGGEALILRQLRLYEEAGGELAIVMVGPHAEEYRQAIAGHPTRIKIVVQSITHKKPHLTPTLLEALEHLSVLRGESYFYFAPVDVFVGDAKVFSELWRTRDGYDAVIPSFGDKGGHPVLLSGKIHSELLASIDPELRLDVFLQAEPNKHYLPVADATYLTNLNEPHLTRTEVLTQAAAKLAAIEIGIGSLLHGFKVPFAGHFLAANQIFFLSRTVWVTRADPLAKFLPANLSLIVAMLKGLSPMGKRLTPMVAISAQGLWFNLGVFIGGANAMGLAVGGALASLWTLMQPLFFAYVVFGKTLFEAATTGLDFITKYTGVGYGTLTLSQLFQTLVIVHIAIGAIVGLFGRYLTINSTARYELWLLSAAKGRSLHKQMIVSRERPHDFFGKVLIVLKDMSKPLFLLPFVITALFVALIQSDYVSAIWLTGRSFGIAFVLFYVVRWFPIDRILQNTKNPWIKSRAEIAKQVIAKLREI